MSNERKRKKFRRGNYKPATDAELTAAAEITAADIADAQQLWREKAPRIYKSLLDASATNEQSESAE